MPGLAGADANENNSIALRLAAVNNDPMLASYLLGFGCNVNGSDDKGFTCLHLAATRGLVDMAHFLLVSGADPFSATHNGLLPIHCAAAGEHYGIILLLCSKEAATLVSQGPKARRVIFPVWRGEQMQRGFEGAERRDMTNVGDGRGTRGTPGARRAVDPVYGGHRGRENGYLLRTGAESWVIGP
jgi:hypothetical protein